MTDPLFDVKGYQIQILSSDPKMVRWQYVIVDGEKYATQILYIGASEPEAAAGEEKTEETEESAEEDLLLPDPYAVRSLGPIVTEPLPKDSTAGLGIDEKGQIWTGYWSQVLLKDPAIRKNGLTVRVSVPEETAKACLLMSFYVDGVLLGQFRADRAGIIERHFDIEQATAPLRSYLCETHRIGRILLEELIRICEKYGLTYYLFCGTLLGAVRHRDFVPWDDDTDVAMTRENYDLFCRYAKEEWKDSRDFCLITPDGYGKDVFLDYMTRIVYLKESPGCVLLDSAVPEDSPLRGKMAMDLFLLERASDRPVLHRIQTQLIRGIYGLAMGHRLKKEKMDNTKPGKDRRLAAVLIKAGRILPLSFLLGWYRHVCGWFKKGRGDSYFQSNGYIMCIPWKFKREWFGEGKTGRLGELDVTLPQDADSCLRRQYGEYYSLPHPYHRAPLHRKKDD